MDGIDKLMVQFREKAAKALDPNRSTVAEEIDAMDWQFSELARLVSDLERQPDKTTRQFMAEAARRHLNTPIRACGSTHILPSEPKAKELRGEVSPLVLKPLMG